MGAEPGARARRILLAQALQNLIVGQLSKIEWQRPAEQLIEHYAKRIDVASGIDVLPAGVGLLGTDIAKGANQRADLGVQRPGIQTLCGRLGHAKIDDVGERLAVHFRDQDVRGLQITVDDGFLVSMLDSLAYRHKKLEPLPGIELVPIAISGDWHTGHIFHHEIGAALGG